jgi:hypothetical protein
MFNNSLENGVKLSLICNLPIGILELWNIGILFDIKKEIIRF